MNRDHRCHVKTGETKQWFGVISLWSKVKSATDELC